MLLVGVSKHCSPPKQFTSQQKTILFISSEDFLESVGKSCHSLTATFVSFWLSPKNAAPQSRAWSYGSLRYVQWRTLKHRFFILPTSCFPLMDGARRTSSYVALMFFRCYYITEFASNAVVKHATSPDIKWKSLFCKSQGKNGEWVRHINNLTGEKTQPLKLLNTIWI